MREWELKEGGALLLGAPPRMRNQIEMTGKHPSNIFNLRSRSKGGGTTKVGPLTLAYFNFLNFHEEGGHPPFGDIFILVNHLHGGPLFSSKVILRT